MKVLDSGGTGSLSAIIKGIDWVTAHAATTEVANMSLGFRGTSSTRNRAISRSVSKGMVFVVAAENDGIDASGYSPASHPDVLTFSAIIDTDGQAGGLGASSWAGPDDTLAYFSNDGSVSTSRPRAWTSSRRPWAASRRRAVRPWPRHTRSGRRRCTWRPDRGT